MTPLQSELFQPVIAVHVIAATVSLALGTLVLVARKGTPEHRLAGRVWAIAMTVTAAGSFAIDAQLFGVHTPLGTFGPIHVLSAITLASLAYAIVAARRANVRGHRTAMISCFAGLAIAGAFTLAPGRTLHAWLVAAGG
jgi:uncharacterized membrane protein